MSLRDFVYGLGPLRTVVIGDISKKIKITVPARSITVKVDVINPLITVKITVLCP